MQRLALTLAVYALLAACEPEQPIAPAPPPQPPAPLPTALVSGFIHDETGMPLAGALVENLNGGGTVTANETGNFSLLVVQGPFTLRVSKEGYESYLRNLVANADLQVDVRLAVLLVVDSIVLSRTIRSTVEAGAAPCDPVHWDAAAPCRRFPFTAPLSGLLFISVSWHGGSELDVTFTTPGGSYLATSRELAPETVGFWVTVEAGASYEIRVNSYYESQVFELKAELVP